MEVTVTARDLGTISDQVSVVIVTGTADGRRVTFAGDCRAMCAFPP